MAIYTRSESRELKPGTDHLYRKWPYRIYEALTENQQESFKADELLGGDLFEDYLNGIPSAIRDSLEIGRESIQFPILPLKGLQEEVSGSQISKVKPPQGVEVYARNIPSSVLPKEEELSGIVSPPFKIGSEILLPPTKNITTQVAPVNGQIKEVWQMPKNEFTNNSIFLLKILWIGCPEKTHKKIINT